MKQIVLTLFFVFTFFVLCAQNFTISGYVRDEASGENLIGANIFNLKNQKGTTTNYYGFYSLTLPRDSVQLTCSYVGYKSKLVSFYLNQDTTIDINLSSGEMLEEVVVSSEEGISEQTQMSKINIPVENIKSLPALMGETDVLKVIQLLPGVQSGTEGTSGIYVRGGGPDQNLILLDGVPVYNASHLFGAFSIFNADAINNIDLIKGGFPARYGGRLSSVVDISLKEGNMKEFHGEGSIGLIAAKASVEGPIVKDKSSFLISGRRTYFDLFTIPITKTMTDDGTAFGYFFHDLTGKFNYKLSRKDRLYASIYYGKDDSFSKYEDFYYDENNARVDYNERADLFWGNIISAVRWNHVFNPKLFGNLTATYSRYNFTVRDQFEDSYQGTDTTYTNKEKTEYISGIRDYALRMDLDYLPAPNHFIKFGVGATYHKFTPGVLAFNSTVESDTTIGSDLIYSNEFVAYAEDDFLINELLKVNLGVHANYYMVDDADYFSIQPRLSARLQFKDSWALKASYVTMQQPIHLLTNSTIGLPTDLWVPATGKVKPQTAKQWATGITKEIEGGYELSLEGYYKTMDNVISYSEGASYLNTNEDWQNKVETGKGESYGAEVFLQKKKGKFSGWIGYTLSWSWREFEEINFGERYPYKYDRRHDVSVTGVYKPNKEFEISASWVYGTGNAFTLPLETYPSAESQLGTNNYNETLQYFDSKNSWRMPAYHRLDLSLKWKKQTKWGERAWVLSLYNAYSRKNPFYMDIGYDKKGRKKFIQYSLFPIIPSISYQFNF